MQIKSWFFQFILIGWVSLHPGLIGRAMASANGAMAVPGGSANHAPSSDWWTCTGSGVAVANSSLAVASIAGFTERRRRSGGHSLEEPSWQPRGVRRARHVYRIIGTMRRRQAINAVRILSRRVVLAYVREWASDAPVVAHGRHPECEGRAARQHPTCTEHDAPTRRGTESTIRGMSRVPAD